MEETRVKRKSKDAKRAKSYNGGSSKGRLDIQDKHRFTKRFSNQVLTKKFPRLVMIGFLTLSLKREEVPIH